MPKARYPAVFREEVSSQRRVPPQVSASNFALVSFFERGPVNEPTIVTDFEELLDTFGEFTNKSIGPTTAMAYFANQGQNLIVVRVVGDGAARAGKTFGSRLIDPLTVVSGGSTGPVSLTVDRPEGETPMVPGEVELRYDAFLEVTGESQGTGSYQSDTVLEFTLEEVPVTPATFSVDITYTNDGDETITDSSGDGTLTDVSGNIDQQNSYIDYETGEVHIELSSDTFDDTVDPVANYDYRLADPVEGEVWDTGRSGTERYYGSLDQIDSWSGATLDHPAYPFIQFSWTDESGTDRTATFDPSSGDITGDAEGTLDMQTGNGHLDFEPSGTHPPADGELISVDYWSLTYLTATDDGQGTIDGPLLQSAQSIDYVEGTINDGNSFDTVPLNGNEKPIELKFKPAEHRFRAKNPGDFGNDIRVRLQGDPNTLDRETGEHGRYDVFIEEPDNRGRYTPVDTFESVVIDDVTHDRHIAQVINDEYSGSDLVELQAEFSDHVPVPLQGDTVDALTIATGDGSVYDIVGDLRTYADRGVEMRGIIPGSVEITYTAGGQEKTVTDDGIGGLQGAVDLATEATIDYDEGVVEFRPSESPDGGTPVEASYSLYSSSLDDDREFDGGDDGAALTKGDVTDFQLSADEEGIYALEDVNTMFALSTPDFAGDEEAFSEQIAYLEDREDSIALGTPPKGASAQQAVDYKQHVLASRSDRGTLYHPHVDIEDPLTGNTVSIPPFGHVAGVWARTDQNRNVGKAPAGIRDGRLNMLQGFSQRFKPAEVETLNTSNINALWKPPEQPRAVWGARTMQTGGEYRYIQARRTIDLITIVMQRAQWWVIFENNGPQLWNRIREQGRQILRTFYNDGVLAGQTEDEAFFVKCDAENNPDTVQAGGEVIFDWGAAVNKPAEFLTQRHRLITG